MPRSRRSPFSTALPPIPAIRVFGDTYYVYPTSDKPNWMTTDFSVWSSKNLIDWKKEGMILDVTKDLEMGEHQGMGAGLHRAQRQILFLLLRRGKNRRRHRQDARPGPFMDALGRPLLDQCGKREDHLEHDRSLPVHR